MRGTRLAVALAGSLALAACADSPPTGATAAPFNGPAANLTLADDIQQQIQTRLPRGFASSVNARWSTVRRRKDAGDMTGAVHHFNQLAAWLDRKTGDFTPPAGITKQQAAAQMVVSMATWLYEGPSATPPAPAGADVAIAVAPAGEEFFMQTPSQHAGVSWDAGSTNEDRLVVLAQDPNPYPGVCNGPLATRRCQYPLFYKLESFPKLRLEQPGRFAVCMVTTGERRPLEYPEDEAGARPVDERLRLAHDLPANPADYTPGATQEDGIEILPKAAQQSGELVDCESHDHASMGPIQKTLYLASQFVARIISPRNAWAWDSGPEHEFSYFSSFNGVDPQSRPDLAVTNLAVTPSVTEGNTVTVSYAVVNASRRGGGHATASSAPSTVRAWISGDPVLDEGDALIGTSTVPALEPDGASFPVSISGLASPLRGSYHVIVAVDEVRQEVSTENNVATAPFTVTAPPPSEAEQPLINFEGNPHAIGGGPNSQQILAQSFVAPRSGRLVEVALPVSCSQGATLVIEVQRASEDVPTGEVLSRQYVPASWLVLPEIVPTQFRRIPLAEPPALDAEFQYALVLKTLDLNAMSCSSLPSPAGDLYDGGNAYFDARPNTAGVWVPMQQDGYDLPFRTVIRADLVDQVNDPETGNSSSCGNGLGLPIYQTFTAGAESLTGVALRMRDGGSFPVAGAEVTIRIRDGSATGSVLGTVSAWVAPKQTGAQRLIRFTPVSPIGLTLGSLYAIELQGIDATTTSWMHVDVNTYGGGQALAGCGDGPPIASPGSDRNFITYR